MTHEERIARLEEIGCGEDAIKLFDDYFLSAKKLITNIENTKSFNFKVKYLLFRLIENRFFWPQGFMTFGMSKEEIEQLNDGIKDFFILYL